MGRKRKDRVWHKSRTLKVEIAISDLVQQMTALIVGYCDDEINEVGIASLILLHVRESTAMFMAKRRHGLDA